MRRNRNSFKEKVGKKYKREIKKRAKVGFCAIACQPVSASRSILWPGKRVHSPSQKKSGREKRDGREKEKPCLNRNSVSRQFHIAESSLSLPSLFVYSFAFSVLYLFSSLPSLLPYALKPL